MLLARLVGKPVGSCIQARSLSRGRGQVGHSDRLLVQQSVLPQPCDRQIDKCTHLGGSMAALWMPDMDRERLFLIVGQYNL